MPNELIKTALDAILQNKMSHLDACMRANATNHQLIRERADYLAQVECLILFLSNENDESKDDDEDEEILSDFLIELAHRDIVLEDSLEGLLLNMDPWTDDATDILTILTNIKDFLVRLHTPNPNETELKALWTSIKTTTPDFILDRIIGFLQQDSKISTWQEITGVSTETKDSCTITTNIPEIAILGDVKTQIINAFNNFKEHKMPDTYLPSDAAANERVIKQFIRMFLKPLFMQLKPNQNRLRITEINFGKAREKVDRYKTTIIYEIRQHTSHTLIINSRMVELFFRTITAPTLATLKPAVFSVATAASRSRAPASSSTITYIPPIAPH